MSESPQHGDRPLPDPAVLHRMLENSDRYSELADPQRRRRQVFDALAESEDPMWREIGRQLRDGQLTPRDLFQVDAYATKIEEGLVENAEQFRASMAEAAAQLEAEQDEDPYGRER